MAVVAEVKREPQDEPEGQVVAQDQPEDQAVQQLKEMPEGLPPHGEQEAVEGIVHPVQPETLEPTPMVAPEEMGLHLPYLVLLLLTQEAAVVALQAVVTTHLEDREAVEQAVVMAIMILLREPLIQVVAAVAREAMVREMVRQEDQG